MSEDEISQALATLSQHLQTTLPNARIDPHVLPDTEGLRLGLINADFPTGPLDPEVMHAVIAAPAYWSFCWGSGLATAQWLHAHPEIVADKRIGDLGSGSGVVAIAAQRCGAASVIACDNDPHALAATVANAQLNGLHLSTTPIIEELRDLDILFVADVLYDKSNYPLLQQAKSCAKHIIVADSRISTSPDPEFEPTHQIEALTYPNLGEFEEFRRVQFFEWRAPTTAT
ncbi:MAG: 50S ribosomal protein L11 methyltransferase [Pseudomonadota bacterium]